MTGAAVLIAAYSARALAEAARRAGYVPLVVDAFADEDTRAAAHAYENIPGAVRHGFSAKTLFAAIDRLCDAAPEKPLGIVLGSGFEDRPRLIESLDARYGLLGTGAETVREVKDPRRLFPLLKQLRIRHPETLFELPAEPDGWLAKQAGGAGGTHIRDLADRPLLKPSHYFQRRLLGTPMSVLAVASRHGMAMELSRQWTTGSSRKPCRYGGAVIADYADTPAERKMIEAAVMLVELLDPVGLWSFDFLVADGEPHLLEINPRPGATLDIFDDHRGNLFRAHIEAALGNGLWQERDLPAVQSRASAVLYADGGPLTIGHIEWPAWAKDRPSAGTKIAAEQPIATATADGASADAAERLVRERLSSLKDLVYRSTH